MKPIIKAYSLPVTDYDVFLYGNITETEDYIELASLLNNAGEEDTITIHIDSDGGVLLSALILSNAIEHSSAHVVGIIDGVAKSAGAHIFLACPELHMMPFSLLMLHQSTMSFDDLTRKDLQSYLNAADGAYDAFMKHGMKKVLTDKEIDSIFNHKEEIYLSQEQFQQRLLGHKEENI